MKKKNSFAGAVVLLLSSTFFLLFAVGMIFLLRYGEDAPPLGFAIMFFIFGALMLFGGISEILLIKGEELIKKEGYYKIAKFVSYKLGKEVGTQTTNARYYSISYSYLDVDGEITAKSRPIYTMDEVKYFLDKKEFNIKVLKGKSVIVEEPFEKKDIVSSKQTTEMSEDDKQEIEPQSDRRSFIGEIDQVQTVYCPNCLKEIEKSKRRCPNCHTRVDKF